MTVYEWWNGIQFENSCTYFKLLLRHLHGKNEENHEILSDDSQSPDQDSNPVPPEYETADQLSDLLKMDFAPQG
jgi:hypothetical protein